MEEFYPFHSFHVCIVCVKIFHFASYLSFQYAEPVFHHFVHCPTTYLTRTTTLVTALHGNLSDLWDTIVDWFDSQVYTLPTCVRCRNHACYFCYCSRTYSTTPHTPQLSLFIYPSFPLSLGSSNLYARNFSIICPQLTFLRTLPCPQCYRPQSCQNKLLGTYEKTGQLHLSITPYFIYIVIVLDP